MKSAPFRLAMFTWISVAASVTTAHAGESDTLPQLPGKTKSAAALMAELQQARGKGVEDIEAGAKRLAIARQLAQQVETPETVLPTLVQLLDDPGYWGARRCSTVGERVGDLIAGMGPRARPAIPLLEERLPTRSERIERILGALAPERYPFHASGEPAVAPLIRILKSGDLDERRRAAIKLGELRQIATPAVPVLLATLRSDNIFLRLDTAEALWRIRRHPRSVEVAIRECTHSDPFARTTSVTLLSKMWWPGSDLPVNHRKRITAAMDAVARSPQSTGEAKARAATFLWQAGRSSLAIQTWQAGLLDEDDDVQLHAIRAVRAEPEAAELLTPSIALLLSEKRGSLRGLSGITLRKLGPKAKAALPIVEQALGHKSERVRRTAQQVRAAILKQVSP